jgi:hypothetical protein
MQTYIHTNDKTSCRDIIYDNEIQLIVIVNLWVYEN